MDEDQLSLAKELIKRKASKFAPEKFKDEYEAALREMVEAKVKHAPIPKDEPAPKSGKVINLMDALRKSVQGDEAAAAPKKKAAAKSAAAAKKGITLVKPAGPRREIAEVGVDAMATKKTAQRSKSRHQCGGDAVDEQLGRYRSMRDFEHHCGAERRVGEEEVFKRSAAAVCDSEACGYASALRLSAWVEWGAEELGCGERAELLYRG